MSRNSFIKSSAILFVGDLLTKILGFVYLAPLARIDGGIGTIQGFLMTPYSFFITFSVLGITNVMMYKLGPVVDDKDRFKHHFMDGLYYVLITSVVITGMLILFSKQLMESVVPTGISYLPDLVASLRIIAVSILFYAVNTLIRSVLLSKSYVTIISVTYITEQLIKLVILLAGCYYFISVKGQDVAVSSYVTAWSVTISVASTTVIMLAYAFKIKLFDFMDGAKYKWKIKSFKPIFMLGAVYFVNNIFLNGFNQIDLLMMSDSLVKSGHTVAEAESITGIYFTWSWKLIMLVVTLGGTFLTIMVQQMTRVLTTKEKVIEMKRVFDIVLLYTLLATVFFHTAGIDFYEWFYGTSEGTTIMMVQAILIAPVMLRMLLSVFAITVGQRRVVLLSTAVIFAVKIILNPILFNFFEVYGFILASFIACISSIGFMLIMDHKIFHFSREEFNNIIKICVRMLVLYVISIAFSSFIHSFEISDFISLIIISIEILLVFGLLNISALKQLKTMI